tara:strand:+ start:6636 stop:7739 length:1104 start_codon:yes stop_codon:yes gene_type:complete
MEIHVCIITQNSEKTILNQLSLLKTIKPSKYFIFDNNSNDNTIQIIQNIADENIEIISQSTFTDPWFFYNEKIDFFLRNCIVNCNYFLIFSPNIIFNEQYINSFQLESNFKNYYGLAKLAEKYVIKFPFLLSTKDEWYIDNNNEIINITKNVKTYVCSENLSYIKPEYWNLNCLEKLQLNNFSIIKDPSILFNICNALIFEEQLDETLYYFQIFNYSLHELPIQKENYKHNLYFLCYRIVELFLKKEIYNREIVIEISKIAITCLENRAEIYHYLGIFFYKAQNYPLSLYFFENAISKKLYLDCCTSDKIYPNAYKLEYNSLMLISAFLSNDHTKLDKYLLTFKKYCSNIPCINAYIDFIESSFIDL